MKQEENDNYSRYYSTNHQILVFLNYLEISDAWRQRLDFGPIALTVDTSITSAILRIILVYFDSRWLDPWQVCPITDILYCLLNFDLWFCEAPLKHEGLFPSQNAEENHC